MVEEISAHTIPRMEIPKIMFQEEREMKRKIGLLALTLAAGATLAGCSNASTPNPSPSAPAVAPTASAAPSATPEVSPNTVTQGVQRAARDAEDKVEDILEGAGRKVRNADEQRRDDMR